MSGGGAAARPSSSSSSSSMSVAGGGGGCHLYGALDEIRRVDIDGPNPVGSSNFNPNFKKVRYIEQQVKTTLKGGDGLIATARSELLHQVVDTPGVREQAHVVIGEMCGSMPLGGGGDVGITDDEITVAQDDVLTELMSDVPLTGAITAVGNLFLSLHYRNNPFRIGAAVGAATAAGITASEGGLGRVASLSVGACGTLLTALMLGYGYVMAPGEPPVSGVPPVSGPFNASHFEQYLAANIPLLPEAAADSGIIEQIRVGLRSELRNPRNIAYAVSDLSCRLVDRICPASDDFQPLRRFNMQPLAAAGDSNLFTVINAMRDGVAGFLNYLLGLLDIVRKVPYQRVGVVGPEDQSISYNMRLKMTDLIANLFASFRAQGLLTGIIDDKLMNLYLSSLINMIFPSEILFSARTGNNYEAHKELLFLTHKIKDRVIRRWTARGPEYTEDKLLKIFTCFGSRFTELALKMFKDEDPFSCVFVAGSSDSMNSMKNQSSDSPPEQRLASVQWDWFNKCARGEVPVFEKEKVEYDSIASTEWGITSVVLRPDGLARATKTWLSSAAVSAGAATNQQLLNMSEEPAAPRGIAIPHNFPPPPLMFLSNIQAVLRKIQEIVDKELSQEDTISAIMKAYEDFGDPTLVSQYVKSIVTLSRVWSEGKNPDIFTLATKKDRNGNEYPIVVLNLDSIDGWTVTGGKFIKVEIPSALLFGLGTKFIQVVGSCVSRIAQQTRALLCSDDAEAEAEADAADAAAAAALPPAVVELGGESAEARNAVLVDNIDVCDKHLEMAAGGGVMAEIKNSSESLKVVVAEEQDEAAKEEARLEQQQEILAADHPPPLITISSHNPAGPGGVSQQPEFPFDQQAGNADADVMRSSSETLEQSNLPAAVVKEKERSTGKFGVAYGQPGPPRSSGPPGTSGLGGKSRSKSRKNTKRTRRNKGRKSSKAAKKTQQRRSSRYRRSSRKGRK